MDTTTATQSAAFPTVEDVEEFVECLFDEGTTVKETSSDLTPSEPIVYAPYLNASGAIDSYLICDIHFANSSGAALSMIHPSSAADAAKEGIVPENVFENVKEVLNIATGLVGTKSNERLTLGEIQIVKETSGVELSDSQIAWEIEIPRYAQGKLILGKIITE